MDAYSLIRYLARRRTDRVTEKATISCTECDDYDARARYAGETDAGSLSSIFSPIADITTCPVCGAPTDVRVE